MKSIPISGHSHMNPFQKTLFLGLACFALTACGGTGGSASAAPSPGTPEQPFAQRLTQAESPKSLVNDPEAMKRILGEDKGNNGIRDDVDTFIATLTTDLVELKALQQYAKSLQKRFLASNKNEAYSAGDLLVRAHKCGNSIAKEKSEMQGLNPYTSFDQIAKKIRNLRQETVNSVERIARSNEVDVLSHGHSFSFGPSDNGKQWCD